MKPGPAVLTLILALAGCVSDGDAPATTVTHAPTTTTIAPTTTQAPTTTTTSSTTTSSTTTQAAYRVACNTNKDCGDIVEARICHQGNVYVNRVTPVCQGPGTPYARCIEKTDLADSPKEYCTTKGCKDGNCEYR